MKKYFLIILLLFIPLTAKASTYDVMVELLQSGKPSLIREERLRLYAQALENGSQEFNVDLNIVIALAHLESSFRNIQNSKHPYDSGVMQVLPGDRHIRSFIRDNYDKPRGVTYRKWLKDNPIEAIRVGVWELSFFRREWKRYIHKRCTAPLKFQNMLIQDGKDFRWLPHYNWGPHCLYKTKHKKYPIMLMNRYAMVKKLVNRLLFRTQLGIWTISYYRGQSFEIKTDETFGFNLKWFHYAPKFVEIYT